MNRIFVACAAVALGAGVAAAASPEVDKAIKTIQSVGAAKMQPFCDLVDTLDDADEKAEKAGAAAADKEDPAVEQQVDALLTQLGADFEAAWDAGEELDENSADGKEYAAAVDALADKCQ
jgi:hypothetical protein